MDLGVRNDRGLRDRNDGYASKRLSEFHESRYSRHSVLVGYCMGIWICVDEANQPYYRNRIPMVTAISNKSASTTEKYITYMEEAYLLFSLLRYSPKSVERIKSPKKVYVVDNGFVGAKAIQHSPDRGKLMENLAFTELVKRGVKPNHELFYYKTRNDREIDFVLKKGYQVTELIQASYELTSQDVEEREVKALVEAGGELNVTKLTVLTWNEKREARRDGKTVQFLPLWEWLLNPTSNL